MLSVKPINYSHLGVLFVLSVHHLLVISRAVALATRHGETELADSLNGILTNQEAMRAKHTESLKNRKGGGNGAPKLAYAIDVDPVGTWYAKGMVDAHEILKERLKEHDARGSVPNVRSMAAIVSAKGHWMRMVDTANGMVTFTLRKATPDELA